MKNHAYACFICIFCLLEIAFFFSRKLGERVRSDDWVVEGIGK